MTSWQCSAIVQRVLSSVESYWIICAKEHFLCTFTLKKNCRYVFVLRQHRSPNLAKNPKTDISPGDELTEFGYSLTCSEQRSTVLNNFCWSKYFIRFYAKNCRYVFVFRQHRPPNLAYYSPSSKTKTDISPADELTDFGYSSTCCEQRRIVLNNLR